MAYVFLLFYLRGLTVLAEDFWIFLGGGDAASPSVLPHAHLEFFRMLSSGNWLSREDSLLWTFWSGFREAAERPRRGCGRAPAGLLHVVSLPELRLTIRSVGFLKHFPLTV